jgi:DNA-binding protein HU-beta
MINKPEIISKMAKKSGMTEKDSKKAFEALLSVIEDILTEGEKVTLMGIGVFELKERAARKGKNPRTQEEIIIPATKYPNFKISQLLKEKIKNKNKGN